MEIESMSPAAGNSMPSQKMSNRTGYWKGDNPDDVILSMEYDEVMAEINKLPEDEREAAIAILHRRQREQKMPYKH